MAWEERDADWQLEHFLLDDGNLKLGNQSHAQRNRLKENGVESRVKKKKKKNIFTEIHGFYIFITIRCMT